MNATNPTTRSVLAFLKLIDESCNVFVPCLILFHTRHPTNPLVSRERRQTLPCCEGRFVSKERRAQISWHVVRCTARHSGFRHTLRNIFSIKTPYVNNKAKLELFTVRACSTLIVNQEKLSKIKTLKIRITFMYPTSQLAKRLSLS